MRSVLAGAAIEEGCKDRLRSATELRGPKLKRWVDSCGAQGSKCMFEYCMTVWLLRCRLALRGSEMNNRAVGAWYRLVQAVVLIEAYPR